MTGLLSSQGGSVVAQCSGSADNRRVYLVSWTPAQGYSVSQVRRGPSEEAEIEFDSASTTVTATIQCGRNGPEQEVEVEGYPGGGGGGGGGGDG